MVLIGYWPLNESSGSTAYDHSGNENHGSLNGGVTQGATGILGASAYSFDGVDDSVNSTGARPTLNDWTLSFWANPDDVSEGRPVGGYNNQGFTSRLSSGNIEMHGRMSDGANYYSVAGSINISTGTWYHFIGRRKGSDWSVWVNGSLDTEQSKTSETLYSGAYHRDFGMSNNEKYAGKIADVRIYNHALTPSEIQYLYEVSQRGRQVSSSKQS